MAEFIAFIILFVGGIWLLGFSFGLTAFQGVAFVGGILLISISMAMLMRQRGSATRRKDGWSQEG